MAASAATNRHYRFGEFQIDVKNRVLARGSETVPLTPKTFDLLLLLVENSGSLLKKDELIERIWDGAFVEDGNLARTVSFLRKALGERRKDPEYIVTVAGHGYRFIAQVEEFSGDGAQSTAQQQMTTTRVVGDRTITYFPGRVPTKLRAVQVPSKTVSHRRTKRLVLLVGASGIALLAVSLAFVLRESKRPQPTVTPDSFKTIAVLPSRPSAAEDRDPASEFGLAASLINRLSGIRSLTVRPAAAIIKYTSPDQDPIEAGREQQVNYVLASSYRKSGEKVVLAAQLINVHDRSVLWSDTCEEQCNTFAWQDALAEKTTRSLLTTLTDSHRQVLTKHGTENQRAYDLFNLGLYGWYTNKYDTERLQKSAEYLQQAIALDPNYVMAYAWLATINCGLGLGVGAARKEYNRKADELARKALELDDTLIQAHLVLGFSAYSYHWDWGRAEEHFKRARELNPEDVEVARTYAAYLASLIEQARKALTMVYATPTLYFIWRCYEQQHIYEEAYRALQELLATEKEKATAELVSRTYAASGYEKARGVYLKRKLKDLEKQAQQEKFNPLDAAIACSLLGDRDEAFRWLEKAYEYHVQGLIYLNVDPEFDNLRSDPRFTDLTRRIGFQQ